MMGKWTFWLSVVALAYAAFLQAIVSRQKDVSVQHVLEHTYRNNTLKIHLARKEALYYRDEGPTAPIKDPPVMVLLHGSASTYLTWDAWVDTFKASYRILRLDLPGFGLTGHVPQSCNYSLDAYVAFLDSFLDISRVNKVVLAGNSLGGSIAWRYAAKHPERVSHLILVNSGHPYESVRPFFIQLAHLPVINQLLTIWLPRWMIRVALESAYYDKSKVTEHLVDRYHSLMLRSGNRKAFIYAMAGVGLSKRDTDKYALMTIRTPTLLLHGCNDTWIEPYYSEWMRRDIANSTLIMYENAGHVLQEELPRKTAWDVMTWLQKH